ncbi:MAG: 50S ribosomal protein L22 [Actinomycetota bacterium]
MATTTSNRPGTKAQVKFVRMSASKVRQVLNLVRGKQVGEAADILKFSERGAAKVVEKALASAVANAQHNEELIPEELFISACYADEGPTLKRFRPRARGRAGRIHKQTCHITVEVSRLTDDELDQLRASAELRSERRASTSSSRSGGGDRAARVAKSRAAQADDEADEVEEDVVDEVEDQAEEAIDEVEAEAAEVSADTEEADAEVSADAETSSDEEPSGDDGASDGADDEAAEVSADAEEEEK